MDGDFTIGICATGEARKLGTLLDRVRSEHFGNSLPKIVIVASDCAPETLIRVRREVSSDPRILLIEESSRHGKAEAINRIAENSSGRYIVFINSDAMPEEGSIQQLLKEMETNHRVGVISACPYFDAERRGALAGVEALMWDVHNQSSLLLNHMHLSNHSSDEMAAVRRTAFEELPEGLVNDGAFIAGRARLKGYLVNFCEQARVRIDVPQNFRALIQQRRRIIYGHLQVRKLTGATPRTVESLMFFSSPRLALTILLRSLRRSPRSGLFLPLAMLTEGISGLLAASDFITGRGRVHGVWRRYGRD